MHHRTNRTRRSFRTSASERRSPRPSCGLCAPAASRFQLPSLRGASLCVLPLCQHQDSLSADVCCPHTRAPRAAERRPQVRPGISVDTSELNAGPPKASTMPEARGDWLFDCTSSPTFAAPVPPRPRRENIPLRTCARVVSRRRRARAPKCLPSSLRWTRWSFRGRRRRAPTSSKNRGGRLGSRRSGLSPSTWCESTLLFDGLNWPGRQFNYSLPPSACGCCGSALSEERPRASLPVCFVAGWGEGAEPARAEALVVYSAGDRSQAALNGQRGQPREAGGRRREAAVTGRPGGRVGDGRSKPGAGRGSSGMEFFAPASKRVLSACAGSRRSTHQQPAASGGRSRCRRRAGRLFCLWVASPGAAAA